MVAVRGGAARVPDPAQVPGDDARVVTEGVRAHSYFSSLQFTKVQQLYIYNAGCSILAVPVQLGCF